jgi:deazaflavin-dependent oxidoreductase (nitroreductase family)
MALKQAFTTLLKHTLNPLTKRLARTRFGPFALVRHVGRRSGKTYETPIIVAPTENGVIVELTYGPDVDWYKNVRAAGRCAVIVHGNTYEITRFEPMDAEAGRAAFPAPARVVLRLLGRTHFVRFLTN